MRTIGRNYKMRNSKFKTLEKREKKFFFVNKIVKVVVSFD